MNTTTFIHPTAIVEPGAQLGTQVFVGPYAYIGANVRLGDRCRVEHHATVDGYTTLGTDNEIHPYSFIGAKTHDLKYKGGRCFLTIGNHNVFREYVSIHTATADGDATVIGNHNYILAFSHIGHDCQLGDNIIMSAQVATGGHVHIGNAANIGGNSSIHQFCHIGTHAMLAGHAFLKKDLPPFMIAFGSPAVVKSYNYIGMTRHGFSPEECAAVKHIFKVLYESNWNRSQSITQLHNWATLNSYPKLKTIFFDFLEKASIRGLI